MRNDPKQTWIRRVFNAWIKHPHEGLVMMGVAIKADRNGLADIDWQSFAQTANVSVRRAKIVLRRLADRGLVRFTNPHQVRLILRGGE